MRLDHLLSREEVEKMCFTVELSRELNRDLSGADAVDKRKRKRPEVDRQGAVTGQQG